MGCMVIKKQPVRASGGNSNLILYTFRGDHHVRVKYVLRIIMQQQQTYNIIIYIKKRSDFRLLLQRSSVIATRHRECCDKKISPSI